ncbi:MAG: glycosyltransferase family 1 protein [Magnetococcales bacterium]|nr:glycosyltransferase family 1 protein [Magnetococcales bacterium]MBF0321757.1 glycosyltransferase family 1 protein [Magnetococcales bacterium]
MSGRKKIVMFRTLEHHTASRLYCLAMARQGVDLVEIPFDHTLLTQPVREIPPADLVLMVDCGMPVVFPGLPEYAGRKGYVSIDSCHKLEQHKKYVADCGFHDVWVAQKHVVDQFPGKGRWLPLAADPWIHATRPELARQAFLRSRCWGPASYDVGMCGAPYPHRRQFARLFRKHGFSTNFHFRRRFGELATWELSRCTVGFNVGAGYTGLKGQDMNMRIFETMANGQCMLLTNTYPGLGYEELFEVGVHYATFASDQEALDKVRHYVSHPLEAIDMARRAQSLILAQHTYDHRCQAILRALS